MWLFPWLSYAAIAGMGAVLVAMAFTPGLQQDFKFSCITLVVAIAAYLIVKRLRQPRDAPYPRRQRDLNRAHERALVRRNPESLHRYLANYPSRVK